MTNKKKTSRWNSPIGWIEFSDSNNPDAKAVKFTELSLKLWDWIRRRKEYKLDFRRYEHFSKNRSLNSEEMFKKRWKFSPHPPDTKLPPEDLYDYLADVFKEKVFSDAVIVMNFDVGKTEQVLAYNKWADEKNPQVVFKNKKKKRPPEIPQRLEVSIDYKQPLKQITKELSSIIRVIEKVTASTPSRPNYSFTFIRLQSLILKNIGKSNKDIKKFIFSQRNVPLNETNRDSHESYAKRILKWIS